MLAASAGPWTGWYVIPKHVVSDNPGKWSSWVVEAEEPPPARAFKARGNYATIQRHVNERAMHPAARVWAKPISHLERERKGSHRNSNPKTPWDTEEQTELDVDQEGEDDGEHAHTPMATTNKKRMMQPTRTRRDDEERAGHVRPRRRHGGLRTSTLGGSTVAPMKASPILTQRLRLPGPATSPRAMAQTPWGNQGVNAVLAKRRGGSRSLGRAWEVQADSRIRRGLPSELRSSRRTPK